MFLDEDLQSYLETSPTIKSQGLVIAEWNMNQMDNIYRIGNYRYRPTSLAAADSKFTIIASSFDDRDTAGLYTGGTDADVLVDGGYEDGGIPATAFKTVKEKEQMLYSLEDCFGRFRPRSGINKIRYFDDRFLHFDTPDMAQRPRYYMADKTDTFKYWTSYRTENGIERGISKTSLNIDDTAPFVVYKNPVPTNRIVVKTQTHVGSLDLGLIVGPSGSTMQDPFFGESNKVAPGRWKIQYLDSANNWVDAIKFNASDLRRDDTPIVGADGYLEISYGLNVPDQYKDIFVFAGEVLSVDSLPDSSINGYSYLYKTSPKDTGTFYIWLDDINLYQSFAPKYEWHLADNEMNNTTNFVTELVNVPQFGGEQTLTPQYREFMYINGLRIVVDTLTKSNSTLDLIEMSPRLVADLSDKVTQYSVTKQASDIGNAGLPVGQLLAGTGSLSIFDYDDSFNESNNGSIINRYLAKNLQIKFYDKIVNLNGYNYFVPLKAMYAETFPQSSPETKDVTINLRDMFLYFESLTAPQVLLRDTTLSYAISLLLDSVGFSNYVFKRNANEADPVIPFFFIPPDISIADILNRLAVSTQSAMFFDEYNNFVVMSKEYMLPAVEDRPTDMTLYGSADFVKDSLVKNSKTQTKLANIISIASQNNEVYNDGKIVYTARYIEKKPSVDTFYNKSDKSKLWIQTPSLLWQISGDQMVAAKDSKDDINSELYSLAAVTLNSNLPAVAPTVQNNQVVNNIIDLGESVQLLVRGTGYLYANGEVIKYDAMQYAVATANGTEQLRWISNAQEYQDALSKMLPGSKIYQTGLVRIFSEPYYEQIQNTELFRPQNGNVIKHGRGQFGTSIVAHSSGLDPYWTDNGNNPTIPEANRSLRICNMSSKYLFGSSLIAKPTTTFGKAGIVSLASRVSLPARTGIIKNYFSENKLLESEINTYQSAYGKNGKRVDGVVQSSALVMQGPTFATTEDPLDYISYVYKKINKDMTHFGTRLRIIGKKQDAESLEQYATGGTTYYNTSNSDPSKSVGVSGGSGGLGVLLDPSTNNGYYLELIALSNSSSSSSRSATDENGEVFHDVMFYKIQKETGSTDTAKAIPVKLWSGLSNILVNYGDFVGQGRTYTESYPTVYDVAVEYKKVGSRLRFYLYINGKMLTIVEDENPIKNADGQIITNNTMAMFVRGGSRLMFENVYAIGNNYASNTGYAIASTDSTDLAVFGDKSISIQEALRKYAISGVIQSAHLSGISATEPPKYNIYYDEFGTILREAAYFNVRYDKAYPALSAKMYDSRRGMKGYTVSGFIPNAYSAEFMLFNNTDQTLVFRENTDNYPFIYGITFTQESTKELTLDDFFNKLSGQNNTPLSNLSYPDSSQSVFSPQVIKERYYDIKASRSFYGKKDFTLEAPYIQSNDQAQTLMSWIISKIMKPRKSIGINLFNMPTLQLGDIVQINYKDRGNVDAVASEDSRFVVYNIEHSRSSNGPEMTVYLSEVV